MGLSVLFALGIVWAAIAFSYLSNLPIGFFVGALSASSYALGRSWIAWRGRGPARSMMAVATTAPLVGR
jgi:zinc/manganese transport system permease protein